MRNKRLYLIFHGRFPNEKAASLFAAKSAEAFSDQGLDVTLIVPRRLKREKTNPFLFYRIQENFNIVYIPTIDFFLIPIVNRIASYVSFFVFSFFVFLYLLINARRKDIIYSNEGLPILVSSFYFPKTVFELHDFPEHKMLFYRLLFKRTKKILCTNKWKYEKIQERFSVSKDKLILEPNAVEIEEFNISISREEARKKLKLPLDKKLLVYTGHLYSWKGVDTLACAAEILPKNFVVYFVGGTEHDVKRYRQEFKESSNVIFVGYRPHVEIPVWQKAADVLVLPNTAKEDISKYYTSPMKLFEYMASKTPIVATSIPSIIEILNNRNAFLCKPDNPKNMMHKIIEVFDDKIISDRKAESAYQYVLEHTWKRRVKRILNIIMKA